MWGGGRNLVTPIEFSSIVIMVVVALIFNLALFARLDALDFSNWHLCKAGRSSIFKLTLMQGWTLLNFQIDTYARLDALQFSNFFFDLQIDNHVGLGAL